MEKGKGNGIYMTADEVVYYFKKGGQTTRQIQILAQLNGCSIEDVVKILQGKGIKTPRMKKENVGNKENEIPKSSIVINGRRYCKPSYMSEKYWQKYKQEIRDMQVEREYHQVKAKEYTNQLKEVEAFLQESGGTVNATK